MNVKILGDGTVGYAMKHIFEDCIDPTQDPDAVIITNHEDYVYDVLNDLLDWYDGLVIIKSTILPDRIERLMNLHDKMCYVPEFLRENYSTEDAKWPRMRIFGGTKENIFSAERVFAYAKGKADRIIHMTAPEASFVKHAINCYLALKVTYFNDLYDIAENKGLDWYNISRAVIADDRVGESHTTVPGFDGLFGFGGKCLPKDLMNFIYYSDSKLLTEVHRANDERRKIQKQEKQERWEDPLGYGY